MNYFIIPVWLCISQYLIAILFYVARRNIPVLKKNRIHELPVKTNGHYLAQAVKVFYHDKNTGMIASLVTV
jgi:hypothetical protein